MKYVKLGITMAALFVMTLQTKGQNMTLTSKQQALVAIAANEAKGNIEGLKAALNEGLETGLTVSEAKEALSQLYAYTGFPRSLNALGALQQVIKERSEAGLRVEEGREADPLPVDYDALKQGTEVQTQLCGGKPFTYTFAPQTDYYLKAHLFGDIFARNNLTFAEREIVTVSAISALPGCEPQLQAHVSGARCMGVSDETLKAMPALLEQKIGTAEAERLRGALAAVFGESYSPVQTVDFGVWPKGERNPYGKFFTGESYLADVGGGVMNVTFEPRCRNNWHIHHKQVQVLICVAGRGWYQEWGKEAVPMTPGTIIAVPAEVKHWHGAAKDSWFQHLTYHKDVQEGASNEWLEAVTDEVYDKLK
ncbi:MAG: carboxymuconolactone decarboxylase family protein [Prevotella sp.]|nr:carboxymuconolactone decarboxylase family protein [Prevotella sp.]